MDRRVYWIWLQRRLPLGSIVINRLFEHFENIDEIYEADESALLSVDLRRPTRQALLNKSLEEAERILTAMQKLGGWILTPEDARYPDLLRQIVGFPAVLYGQGNFPDLNILPAIAVVGQRRATRNGVNNTKALAAGLAAAGMVVVSGGAVGIDAAAHEGALIAGGKTVLVKAAPPDVSYPPENEPLRRRILQQGGAIVTEYPPGCKFYCDYHVRNRLMSGMALGVCVTEAPFRSGSLITANLARDQGREVFAMPGSVRDHHYEGTHQQIRKGATLVTSAKDLLEDYTARYPGLLDESAAEAVEKQVVDSIEKTAPLSLKPQPVRLSVADDTADNLVVADASESAKRVYAHLTKDPLPIDRLAKLTEMTIPETLVLLTELELLGCVGSTAGQQYFRIS